MQRYLRFGQLHPVMCRSDQECIDAVCRVIENLLKIDRVRKRVRPLLGGNTAGKAVIDGLAFVNVAGIGRNHFYRIAVLDLDHGTVRDHRFLGPVLVDDLQCDGGGSGLRAVSHHHGVRIVILIEIVVASEPGVGDLGIVVGDDAGDVVGRGAHKRLVVVAVIVAGEAEQRVQQGHVAIVKRIEFLIGQEVPDGTGAHGDRFLARVRQLLPDAFEIIFQVLVCDAALVEVQPQIHFVVHAVHQAAQDLHQPFLPFGGQAEDHAGKGRRRLLEGLAVCDRIRREILPGIVQKIIAIGAADGFPVIGIPEGPALQILKEVLYKGLGILAHDRVSAGLRDQSGVLELAAGDVIDGGAVVIVVEDDVGVDGLELVDHLDLLLPVVRTEIIFGTAVAVGVACHIPGRVVFQNVIAALRRRVGLGAAGDIVVHAVADEAHLGGAGPGNDVVLVDDVVDAVVVVSCDLRTGNAALRGLQGIGKGVGAGIVIGIDDALGRQVGGGAGTGIARDPEDRVLARAVDALAREIALELRHDLCGGRGPAGGFARSAQGHVGDPFLLIAHAAYADDDELLLRGADGDVLRGDAHADGVGTRLPGIEVVDVDVRVRAADVADELTEVLGFVQIVAGHPAVAVVLAVFVGIARRAGQTHGGRGKLGIIGVGIAREEAVGIVEHVLDVRVVVGEGGIAEDALEDRIFDLIHRINACAARPPVGVGRRERQGLRIRGLRAGQDPEVAVIPVSVPADMPVMQAVFTVFIIVGKQCGVIGAGVSGDLCAVFPCAVCAEPDVNIRARRDRRDQIGVDRVSVGGKIEVVVSEGLRDIAADNELAGNGQVAVFINEDAAARAAGIPRQILVDRAAVHGVVVIVVDGVVTADINAAAEFIGLVAQDIAVSDRDLFLVEIDCAAVAVAGAGVVRRDIAAEVESFDQAELVVHIDAAAAVLGIEDAVVRNGAADLADRREIIIPAVPVVDAILRDKGFRVQGLLRVALHNEMVAVHVDAAAVVVRDVVVDAAADHVHPAEIGIHMDAAAVIARRVVDDLAVLHIDVAVLVVHLDAAAVAVARAPIVRLVAGNGDVVQIDPGALLHVDAAAAVVAVAAVDDATVQRFLPAGIVVPVAVGNVDRNTVCLAVHRVSVAIFERIGFCAAVNVQLCGFPHVEHLAVAGTRAAVAGQHKAVELQRHGFALRHAEAAAVPVIEQADGIVVAAGSRCVPGGTEGAVIRNTAVFPSHVSPVARRQRLLRQDPDQHDQGEDHAQDPFCLLHMFSSSFDLRHFCRLVFAFLLYPGKPFREPYSSIHTNFSQSD